jgi:glycosyltransferase involved in cell wall biosynthesis
VLRGAGIAKVGVYLGVLPGAGGMFQYAQSILAALASLPPRFEAAALYRDPTWEPYLAAYPGIYCLKTISPLFGIRRARRDLWIFPAQDHLAYLARVPALVAVHDLMHRYERGFPEVSAKGRYFLRELRFRGIAATAKGILVDSEFGKQQLIESYGGAPGRVHPLPYVPPAYIHAGTPPGFDARYPLPAKFAFYPAQFWAHKNHRRLLQALAALPQVELILAGAKDREYEALAAFCREARVESRVHFVGRVADQDMPELYRRARCLVMPTFFGPTNIPPLEAFALGCPVAVSGIYGMPEQVGDAALTFDPRSVAGIATALGRLWSDDALCARLRDKGRERARAWDQAAFNRRFESILDAVLV